MTLAPRYDPAFGCWVDFQIADPNAGDERTAWRIDGEWVIGDHTVSFGLDNEEFETIDGAVVLGYRVRPVHPGGIVLALCRYGTGCSARRTRAVVPDWRDRDVRLRYFENGGTFLTKNEAWYIEDNWQITDNFLAYLGVRYELRERELRGGSFVTVKNQGSALRLRVGRER